MKTIGEKLIDNFVKHYKENWPEESERTCIISFVCGMMVIIDAHNVIVKKCQGNVNKAKEKLQELNKDIERIFKHFIKD